MKHQISNLLLVLLALLAISGLFFTTATLAEEATQSIKTVEEPIYTPKLLPDSPFYFLKTIKERIELFLAQTPEAQAEKYAELATRRIAEVKQLVKKEKPGFVEKLMKKHKEHLDKAEEKIEEAKKKGRDVERVLAIVAEATSIHQKVLAEVYEKVPEQAKEAIEHAMEVSSRGQERALEAISKEKREELREHIEERIGQKKTKIKEILEKRLEKVKEKSEKVEEKLGEVEEKLEEMEEKLEECVCITLWDPVCGVNGKTYSNECWLECAKVEKAYNGECREGGKPVEEWPIEPGKLKLEVEKIKP